VTDLIARRIKQTDGRISAKRLLPEARAAGYQGSARNFRRAVASIRADWRQQPQRPTQPRRRGRRTRDGQAGGSAR